MTIREMPLAGRASHGLRRAPLVFALLVLALVAAGSSRPLAPVAGAQVLQDREQTAPPPAAGAAPTSWGAEVATSLRTPFARLLHSIIRVVPRLVAAALTLLVFWAVAVLVRRLARGVARIVSDPTLRHLVVQFSFYAVWAIGALAALDSLGFDPEAVVTGLGLTSIALGFALKDTLSNLVSGLLMLMTRAFEIGDQIVVGETEGTVERIEVRVTHIRTYGGRLVLVPNAEVFTSRVVNNTASPLRRASILVPLDYQQDLRLAMRAIDAAMTGASGVAADPPCSVRLRDLAPGHVALEARFWADARRPDFVNTSCHVRAAIVHALKDAGVAMPNPDSRIVSPGDVERWRAVLGAAAPPAPKGQSDEDVS